jgi:hypothetical protein
MKKVFLVLLMATASLCMQAQSDFSNFSISISNYNRNYSRSQVSSLYYNHYGISQQKLNEFYVAFNMNWGDVVLAIEMSRFLNVPMSTIYDNYQVYGGRSGWNNLAKRHGIKPGSLRYRRFRERMNNENVYWKNTCNDYRIHKNPRVGGNRKNVYPANLMRTPLRGNKNQGRDNNRDFNINRGNNRGNNNQWKDQRGNNNNNRGNNNPGKDQRGNNNNNRGNNNPGKVQRGNNYNNRGSNNPGKDQRNNNNNNDRGKNQNKGEHRDRGQREENR